MPLAPSWLWESQLVPLYTRALPAQSSDKQKLELVHDTPDRVFVLSMFVVDQLVPL